MGAYANGSKRALPKLLAERIPLLDVLLPHKLELFEIVNMQRAILFDVWPLSCLFLQAPPDVRDKVFFRGILIGRRDTLLGLIIQFVLLPDLGLAGGVGHHLLPIVAQRISVALPGRE